MSKPGHVSELKHSSNSENYIVKTTEKEAVDFVAVTAYLGSEALAV